MATLRLRLTTVTCCNQLLATEHAKKNAARTKRKEALSHVQVLKSIAELQLALTHHPGKIARLAFLKEQLSVYKHPPYNEKTGIRFSVKGVARTSDDLQQLTESLIRKHFPDTANSVGLRHPLQLCQLTSWSSTQETKTITTGVTRVCILLISRCYFCRHCCPVNQT